MNAQSSIIQLPSNQFGKDYVIGDLHGCYELLMRLLDALQFDPACDRLFSVGDLIDRGPDSLTCLQLLAQPWFFAVRGNHEKMLLDFFQRYLHEHSLAALDDEFMTGFLWNGGDWVERHFDAGQRCMTPVFDQALQLAARMPAMMVVGEGQQRFHVIHAELSQPPFEAPLQFWTNQDIDQWLERGEIPESAYECLLWARALMGDQQAVAGPAMQTDLALTFCGHTFDAGPRLNFSHFCLDTGAFLSSDVRSYWGSEDYGLTIYDISEGQWLSASYQRKELSSGHEVDYRALTGVTGR